MHGYKRPINCTRTRILRERSCCRLPLITLHILIAPTAAAVGNGVVIRPCVDNMNRTLTVHVRHRDELKQTLVKRGGRACVQIPRKLETMHD